MLPAALARTQPLLAIALLVGHAAAQQPTFDVQEIIGRPRLTATADGALGSALGYGIRFDRVGWEFGAPAGTRDAAPCVLRYELQAIGRRTAGGAFDGVRVADAAPQVDGDTVRYARPGCVERYELRRDGVEQSFVFDSLPEGDGDLVVRGRLQTDLGTSTPGTDVPELRFTRADGAGISVGRVTGIDAEGSEVEGTMRYADGQLDLILPAPFVRDAALPLVLDPLIGPTIAVPSPPAIEWYGLDVAYDASTDLFLVAWSYLMYVFDDGAVHPEVAAQRVAPSGTLVGPLIQIDQGSPVSSGGPVRVAPAGNRPGFVVAYDIRDARGGGLYARYVDAATGSVATRVLLVSEAAFPGFSLHDIGASAPGNTAIVVYGLPSGLTATRLSLDSTGVPTLGGERTLASVRPGVASIATNAGPEDRYLVVWDEQRGTEQNLFSAFLDSDLNLLDGGAIGLSSTHKHAAAVDGDGTKWCVAYKTVTSGSIGCFGVYWDPTSKSAYVTSDVEIAASGSSPAVAWTGESYLIAYGGGARSVDPFTCLPCEGDLDLPFPSCCSRLASQKSSSPSAGDLAMIVAAPQLRPNATFFRADDGLITDLGGGCGRGGRAAATCAIAGNERFTLRVRGALPLAPAALVLSAAPLGLSCGPCTLVADPTSGLAIGVGNTDGRGDAAVRVPLPKLPSLVGASFLEQWLVVGGGSCLGSLDLSNALRVEIQ